MENLYLPIFTTILQIPKIASVITNNQIKFVKSLHQRKFRQKYNKFIAEGEKIVQEVLRVSTYKVDSIYAVSTFLADYSDLLRDWSHKVTEVSTAEMSKISNLVTASPVLVVMDQKEEGLPDLSRPWKSAIYLDDVQDPGNVGTIIRIADWFGVAAIIRSRGSADFYHPKVVQATMGSFLKVDLYTEDFHQAGGLAMSTVGASMHGVPVSEFSWPDHTLLVMGSEGRGMSPSVSQQLDHHVTIPGSADRVAESLNVGMACGILTASLMRQI